MIHRGDWKVPLMEGYALPRTWAAVATALVSAAATWLGCDEDAPVPADVDGGSGPADGGGDGAAGDAEPLDARDAGAPRDAYVAEMRRPISCTGVRTIANMSTGHGPISSNITDLDFEAPYLTASASGFGRIGRAEIGPDPLKSVGLPMSEDLGITLSNGRTITPTQVVRFLDGKFTYYMLLSTVDNKVLFAPGAAVVDLIGTTLNIAKRSSIDLITFAQPYGKQLPVYIFSGLFYGDRIFLTATFDNIAIQAGALLSYGINGLGSLDTEDVAISNWAAREHAIAIEQLSGTDAVLMSKGEDKDGVNGVSLDIIDLASRQSLIDNIDVDLDDTASFGEIAISGDLSFAAIMSPKGKVKLVSIPGRAAMGEIDLRSVPPYEVSFRDIGIGGKDGKTIFATSYDYLYAVDFSDPRDLKLKKVIAPSTRDMGALAVHGAVVFVAAASDCGEKRTSPRDRIVAIDTESAPIYIPPPPPADMAATPDMTKIIP